MKKLPLILSLLLIGCLGGSGESTYQLIPDEFSFQCLNAETAQRFSMECPRAWDSAQAQGYVYVCNGPPPNTKGAICKSQNAVDLNYKALVSFRLSSQSPYDLIWSAPQAYGPIMGIQPTLFIQ